MTDQQLKAAWQYFRMLIGLVLIIAFVYMMLTGAGNEELLSKLLALLFGVMQFGNGAVNLRTNGYHVRVSGSPNDTRADSSG